MSEEEHYCKKRYPNGIPWAGDGKYIAGRAKAFGETRNPIKRIGIVTRWEPENEALGRFTEKLKIMWDCLACAAKLLALLLFDILTLPLAVCFLVASYIWLPIEYLRLRSQWIYFAKDYRQWQADGMPDRPTALEIRLQSQDLSAVRKREYQGGTK